jgi:hemerythrin-like domain-containing protein
MMVNEGSTHIRGEALMQELIFIHDMIRQNLVTITALVKQINTGATIEEIRAQLRELSSNSIVWRLRVNCIQYCHFVHGHHQHEDHLWFPALRQVNPDLHTVIDKLEADHRVVSDLLDAVESAAKRLATDETAREDLSVTLSQLAEHLLKHLDYEETSLASTLRRIQSWPLDYFG